MALGQIHHVDVIPDAGAVVGGVVVAIDAELFPAADGGLGDVGHQVIGNAPGILADQAALVGADGVEIPQQHHAPLPIRMGNSGENLLGHVLGPAVGVGAAAGAAGLPQGHLVVPGVDGGGGGEDDPLAAGLLHDLGQHQGGVEVVVIVPPGLGNALAHGLEAGEVNDGGNFIFGEDFPEQRLVPDVALVEFQGFAGEGLDPIQTLGVGIAEVVHNHHAVAAIEQLQAGVGADITGAAGDQNVHGDILLM